MATRVTRSVYSPAYLRLRECLIEARQDRGLTQAQVAIALSRHQSYVSKYETGERRLDFVEVLEVAEILGLDITELARRVRET